MEGLEGIANHLYIMFLWQGVFESDIYKIILGIMYIMFHQKDT